MILFPHYFIGCIGDSGSAAYDFLNPQDEEKSRYFEVSLFATKDKVRAFESFAMNNLVTERVELVCPHNFNAICFPNRHTRSALAFVSFLAVIG